MFKKNSRGRKIRHYGPSYNTRPRRRRHFWGLVCLAVAVFVIGWLAGPHILDFGTGIWYSVVNPKPSSGVSQPASSQVQPTAQPTQQPTALPEAQQPTTAIVAGRWTASSLSALADEEAVRAAAADAAAQGFTYAIIPLKDTSGYLYYPSQVPLAQGSVAASTVDAALVAKAFQQAGVTPVASLSAFRDPITPYTDRAIGIRYRGKDYMWLDNTAAAGGKAWLNPYHADAVDYIGDLVEELSAMGYEHALLSHVQFPSQVSSKQDFGDVGTATRADALKNAIAGWNTRFEGRVTLWYEYSYNACTAPVPALEATPCQLGVQNLMLRLPVAEEDEVIDLSGLAGIVTAMKDGGCSYVAVRDAAIADFH